MRKKLVKTKQPSQFWSRLTTRPIESSKKLIWEFRAKPKYRKIHHFCFFLAKTGRQKKCWQKASHHANQRKSLSSISAKALAFQTPCKDRTREHRLPKYPKSELFPLITRNVLAAESLGCNRSSILRSVNPKTDKSDQQVLRNSDLNKRSHVMDGKKRNHFDVSLSKRASLRSPMKRTNYRRKMFCTRLVKCRRHVENGHFMCWKLSCKRKSLLRAVAPVSNEDLAKK